MIAQMQFNLSTVVVEILRWPNRTLWIYDSCHCQPCRQPRARRDGVPWRWPMTGRGGVVDRAAPRCG